MTAALTSTPWMTTDDGISVAPFFFPVLLQLLGLITGLIQAYIFAVLAMVYIASATRERRPGDEAQTSDNGDRE